MNDEVDREQELASFVASEYYQEVLSDFIDTFEVFRDRQASSEEWQGFQQTILEFIYEMDDMTKVDNFIFRLLHDSCGINAAVMFAKENEIIDTRAN